MILFKKAMSFTGYLQKVRRRGQTIGFVPTMGALHNGHLALIESSKRATDVTVCSIFVNPAQFNNPTDFNLYPSTLDQDIDQLLKAGCDLLFFPAKEEMYPPDYVVPHYNLGALEMVLEGAYRPGHFQGVCQAVDRLLQLAAPHQVFFGQKDYQQCLVVKKLLALTNQQHIALNIIPTQREKNGLALSSRNLRLSSEQRQKAQALYHTLTFLKAHITEKPVPVLTAEGIDFLKSWGFDVDYVAVADAETLAPVVTVNGRKVVGLIAAAIGGVRLIDNMPLN
jgi:pantoate--beta-alanine ligase